MVAFAGRSNVGKSSLLNVLANRKGLARVSSTPGHTQLLNFFLVNQSAYFVDLPGYGFARAPKNVSVQWEKMITAFLRNNPALKAVVSIFDARRELTHEDVLLLEWLCHHQIPFLAVLTKADKLVRSHQVEALSRFDASVRELAHEPAVLFSATTRQGREELLEAIGRAIGQRGE